MSTGPYSRFLLTLLLPVGLRPLAAQGPDTLSVADLWVRALSEDADTSSARRVLGRPLRVVQHQQRNDDGVLLLDWHYRDFTVSFDAGRRYRVDLTGPSIATSRHVRVGDAAEKVRRLYGRPMHEDAGHMLYAASTSDSETRGITFFLANGRVTRILVGHVISVE